MNGLHAFLQVYTRRPHTLVADFELGNDVSACASQTPPPLTDAQFTCFTGAQVQILTRSNSRGRSMPHRDEQDTTHSETKGTLKQGNSLFTDRIDGFSATQSTQE